MRKQLEEVEEERKRVKEEMEGVKRESGEEVRRWREEAERARDTQTREKESFDIQVSSHLIPMYRGTRTGHLPNTDSFFCPIGVCIIVGFHCTQYR